MRAIKMLHMAESGGGKTGALVSLLDAGYNVRVMDVDNNLSALLNICKNPGAKIKSKSEDLLKRLSFITITEPMRILQGRFIPRDAKMWPKAMGMLDDWKNEDPLAGTVCSLGPISSWTDQDILAIDTLSPLGMAALNFGLKMNGALGTIRTQNEGRRDIGAAQSYIRNFCQYLNDTSVKCHVIVNAHITYVRADGSGQLVLGDDNNVPTQGFPNAIGRAISPEIPRYFGTIFKTEVVGSGAATRRKTYTVSRGNVNLKNIAPMSVAPEYDQETALAEYFAAVAKAEG